MQEDLWSALCVRIGNFLMVSKSINETNSLLTSPRATDPSSFPVLSHLNTPYWSTDDCWLCQDANGCNGFCDTNSDSPRAIAYNENYQIYSDYLTSMCSMYSPCSVADDCNSESFWSHGPDKIGVANPGNRCDEYDRSGDSHRSISYANAEGPYESVDYCLAERLPGDCEVALNRPILIAVIVCNVLKLACFVYLLVCSSRKPLITIGDAVADFLATPDRTTAGAPLLSFSDVRKGLWRLERRLGASSNDDNERHPRTWRPQRPRWFAAASPGRWMSTLLL